MKQQAKAKRKSGGFDPLRERGIPIEKQLLSWSKLNSKPYNKQEVHPYTRVRGIFMNGIETEAAIFGHQFARHTEDLDLKRKLALVRRTEQQQQKAINWLIPGNESTIEVTIGYEQVAVDLTSNLARNTPDPYVKAALDFALLEDFDHLYRYANLLDLTQRKKAESITGKYTEIMPGRPTIVEHRHPFDDVRRHYDGTSADPLVKMQILAITAAEQQTMNFYMNVGNRLEDMVGRGLYLEIAQIEEQHVTHYESLMDPNASWFEMLALHEYTECWLYYSMLEQEVDAQARKVWQRHLDMEIEHLKIACDLLRSRGDIEPEAILPKSMPETLIVFESNVDYVREVLATQFDCNAFETEFLPRKEMPKNPRYGLYQRAVNAGGVPSEQVIESHIAKKRQDYRQEIAGPHPIEKMRNRRGYASAA
ncbi:MAG: hypothetical protein AB1640_04295 [bacterium]